MVSDVDFGLARICLAQMIQPSSSLVESDFVTVFLAHHQQSFFQDLLLPIQQVQLAQQQYGLLWESFDQSHDRSFQVGRQEHALEEVVAEAELSNSNRIEHVAMDDAEAGISSGFEGKLLLLLRVEVDWVVVEEVVGWIVLV